MNRELEAVVVGAVDLGESDRILRLLCAEEGRISVVARGARTSRRRFAGATELGTRVRLVRGRGALPPVVELERLAGADKARLDLVRIAMLAYGCEVCASLAPEGDGAPKLYPLCVAWLAVTEGEPAPGTAARLALEAKALTFAGLAPTLLRCAACGEPIDDPVVFDAEAGGALHARCGGGRAVTRDGLVLVEALRRTPLAQIEPRAVPASLTWLLSDFLQHQLGRPLPTRSFLAGLG